MIKKLLLGNRRLQRFWWKLYRISVKGLNYDRGHVPSANGEEFALRYVVSNLKHENRITLFDVGANRGQYLTMAKMTVENIRVFCFEPQLSAYKFLKAVSERYDEVTILNFGFGEKRESVSLYRNSEASEFASLYPADYSQYNVSLSLKEEINLETIDNYCQTNSIERIHFLKIDVEGHEIAVLKGASKMISSGKINFIQFEFGIASIESRTFLKDFFKILPDYRIFRILPKGLAKINYSEYYELFLTTNYLAIYTPNK